MNRILRRALRTAVPKPARTWLRSTLRARRKKTDTAGRGDGVTRRFEIALPASDERGHEAAANGRLRIEAPSSLMIPRRWEEGGLASFEPEGIGCILALLERLEDGVFFDIGANIAPYSLIAAALTRWRIVAFEPTPEVAQAARRIRAINGLDFVLEESALDETEGRRPLYISPTDSSNSLNSTFRRWERTVTVRVDTLDAYCRRVGASPSVLKIDTETTEPAVLRGGMGLLTTERPWIVCEVLKGRTEDALEELIEPLGYLRYHILHRGRLDLRDRLEGETMYRDWLFAPEPVDDPLAARVRHWSDALQACGPV